MTNERIYYLMYKLGVDKIRTEWRLLVLESLYSASISAPNCLQALHWRMGQICEAVKKLESYACRVVEFKIVETSAESAFHQHQLICEECKSCANCFAGKSLFKKLTKTWT